MHLDDSMCECICIIFAFVGCPIMNEIKMRSERFLSLFLELKWGDFDALAAVMWWNDWWIGETTQVIDRNCLERFNVYLFVLLVILLCSVNGYFIFIPVDGKQKSNQIPFRFQLTSKMLYQIWYYEYIVRRAVVNYLWEINLITKMKSRCL